MRVILWLVVVCAAGTALGSSTKVYTNVWAVAVTGGMEHADAVAKTHEFINKGKVGILEDVFEFELPLSVYERKAKNIDQPLEQVTEMLKNDARVASAEHQFLREITPKRFVDPTDPKWEKQWFLFNNESGILGDRANSSRDLNVVPAWIQGATGLNVVVGVVDNGVDYNHTDIDSNYLHDIDINVVSNIEDAFPVVDNKTGYLLTHGTRCAGIIAMEKDNDKCGVGVAFNSNITGIVLAGDVTDIEEARALGHAHHVIDIYSNSWGLRDNGQIVQEVGTCTEKTLEKACREGRNGKGSIYVFASGNGGRFDDSCAANGYVNSIYTIAIGSADSEGGAPDYDEQCSGKMAVAFVHNSRVLNAATITTYDSCVDNFDGTSAATPAVAGTIALVLEVNPNLTWRDVQYLIAYTSNNDILSKAGDNKMTNGAGLTFSHQFGFGAVDAEAMVTRVRYWTNVPSQEKSTVFISDSIFVQNSSSTSVHRPYSGNITFLEHVIVQISLTFEGEDLEYSNRGDIQLKLTSPHRTTSTILPYRPRDERNGSSYDNWPFLSVHFWGENPGGNWTLTIWNRGKNGTVVARNATFIFYGTVEKPQVIARIPEKCYPACSRGCAAPGLEFCDACHGFRNGTTLECIEECSDEYTVSHGYCVCYSPASDEECVCTNETDGGECMCEDSDCGANGLSVNTVLLMLIIVVVSSAKCVFL